jgi:hypothetical protein
MAIGESIIFTQESRMQLDDLLMEICEEVQLSPDRHGLADQRYETMNRLLEGDSSPFRDFAPKIYPQGSMALGTTVKPLEGPHDLDFVLELGYPQPGGKPITLLLELFGFLKSNGIYTDMTELKNRCVRVTYANDFYMDILPACRDAISGGSCLLVPDRSTLTWTPSNPRGYIQWFRTRAESRRQDLVAKAKPIPAHETVEEKLPLQLAVQLLKRWRDLHFSDKDRAPISIVLTTLAADCYAGEQYVSEAMSAILDGIVHRIEFADSRGIRLAVINPSNPKENFAEKWQSNGGYEYFKAGILKLRAEWGAIISGRRDINKPLEGLFGEYVNKALVKQANRIQEARMAGALAVNSAGVITGLGRTVTKVRPNIFHGDD